MRTRTICCVSSCHIRETTSTLCINSYTGSLRARCKSLEAAGAIYTYKADKLKQKLIESRLDTSQPSLMIRQLKQYDGNLQILNKKFICFVLSQQGFNQRKKRTLKNMYKCFYLLASKLAKARVLRNCANSLFALVVPARV